MDIQVWRKQNVLDGPDDYFKNRSGTLSQMGRAGGKSLSRAVDFKTPISVVRSQCLPA